MTKTALHRREMVTRVKTGLTTKREAPYGNPDWAWSGVGKARKDIMNEVWALMESEDHAGAKESISALEELEGVAQQLEAAISDGESADAEVLVDSHDLDSYMPEAYFTWADKMENWLNDEAANEED